MRRTAHWRERADGLAVFYRSSKVVLQDCRNILFHDCGDRVAQMLLLGVYPPSPVSSPSPSANSPRPHPSLPVQQIILVNTHLLFPHNEYSSKIRMREVTKILGFIENYRQSDMCSTICGRSDVKIPVILTGDFNGSPKGSVFNFIKSQNFVSVLDTLDEDVTTNWISHKNHLNNLVLYDHIFFSNPSDQVFEKLPTAPVWTTLLFKEIVQKIASGRNSGVTVADIFSAFDEDGSKLVSREELATGIRRLGFAGEGTAAVTEEEIDALMSSADSDGDGQINFREFYDLVLAAATDSEQKSVLEEQKASAIRAQWLTTDIASLSSSQAVMSGSVDESRTGMKVTDRSQMVLPGVFSRGTSSGGSETEIPLAFTKVIPNTRPAGDISVSNVQLHPRELESGEWPIEYDLSDHGIIETTFEVKCLPQYGSEDIVDPNPIAAKKK